MPMPLPMPMPLDDDVSFPLAAGRIACAYTPPGYAGVGRGGWHGVAREWDSYIYLNLYTSFHIAFLIIGK